ncbi:MAG: HAD family hydrolase [Spirochaetota bacterium]
MAYFADRRLSRQLDHCGLAVFDMNGLIVDDEEVQLRSVNQVLAGFGISISEEYWMARCVGSRAGEYFPGILAERGFNPGSVDVGELVAEKNARYHRLVASRAEELARPGVLALIGHLHRDPARGLALATSAGPEEIDSILGPGGLGLMDRFSWVVHGGEVAAGKPDPAIYRLVSEKSGVPPDRCLVFEDSGVGAAAAAAAGMACIAAPNRFTRGQDFTGARFLVDSLTPEARVLGIPRRSGT